MAAQLEAVEHRHRILALARDGATAEDIAQVFAAEGKEMAPRSIRASIKRYLDAVHREDALVLEELRAMENMRLDDLERRLKVELGGAKDAQKLKVIDRLIRLSERRSKLNGLDSAVKHEHFIGNGLAALGIEEEHLARAEQAFQTAFTREDIPDVEVVEEGALALPEGSGDADGGAGSS